jgi:hypothetical protein
VIIASAVGAALYALAVGGFDFRNDDRVFGIKSEDRLSHLYIIGKTGTGNSTLIETMAR